MRTFVRKTEESNINIAEILEEYMQFQPGMLIRLDKETEKWEVQQVVYKVVKPSESATIGNLEQYVFVGKYEEEK